MKSWVKTLLPYLPAILLTGILLLLYIPDARYYFFSPDQGFQLAVADQILSGNHPWIDVQGGGYGPFVFYSSAFGQWLFRGVIAGEVFITFVGYFFGYLALFTVLFFMTRRIVVSTVLLLVALLLFPEYYKYYVVLGPALFALGLYVFLCSGHRHGLWVLAGCTAINGLYRFDFGAYSVIPCVIALFLAYRKPVKVAIAFMRFAGMITAFASPWLLFLLLRGKIVTALNNVYVALSNAGSGLALPSPVYDASLSPLAEHNAFALLFYLYPLIPLVCAAVLIVQRASLDPKRSSWLICLIIFSLLLYSHTLHRTSITYLLQVSPMFLVLLAFLVQRVLDNTAWAVRRAAIARGLLAVFAAAMLIFQMPLYHFYLGASFFEKYESVRYNWRIYFQSREEFVRMMASELPADGHRYWMVQSTDYVRQHTEPDQLVLFYPYYPALYYWSERRYGAGYPHLFPAKKGYVEKQESFIVAMKEQDLPLIVFDHEFSFDDDPERNPKAFAPLIIQYIAEAYEPVERYGPTQIYKRNLVPPLP